MSDKEKYTVVDTEPTPEDMEPTPDEDEPQDDDVLGWDYEDEEPTRCMNCHKLIGDREIRDGCDLCAGRSLEEVFRR